MIKYQRSIAKFYGGSPFDLYGAAKAEQQKVQDHMDKTLKKTTGVDLKKKPLTKKDDQVERARRNYSLSQAIKNDPYANQAGVVNVGILPGVGRATKILSGLSNTLALLSPVLATSEKPEVKVGKTTTSPATEAPSASPTSEENKSNEKKPLPKKGKIQQAREKIGDKIAGRKTEQPQSSDPKTPFYKKKWPWIIGGIALTNHAAREGGVQFGKWWFTGELPNDTTKNNSQSQKGQENQQINKNDSIYTLPVESEVVVDESDWSPTN